MHSIFALVLLALILPPEPAGYCIKIDAPDGVKVSVSLDGKEVTTGKVCVLRGYRPDLLTFKVMIDGEAHFMDVELEPGMVTTVTITIRPPPKDWI